VNAEDQTAKDLAVVMLETATLRSGYILPDSAGFADRIDRMLRLSMDISLDEAVRLGGIFFPLFQPHFLFLYQHVKPNALRFSFPYCPLVTLSRRRRQV